MTHSTAVRALLKIGAYPGFNSAQHSFTRPETRDLTR
jgi:hypothetical protein